MKSEELFLSLQCRSGNECEIELAVDCAREIRIAARSEMTTYSAIAPLARLDMENPADRDTIRQILGVISTYEHQRGRPMLTAIVVHKRDNVPGHGFFELARHLGLLKAGADELGFFCGEVARVHAAWKTARTAA